MEQEWLKALIKTVPDFPRSGIEFKDITPVLYEPHALKRAAQNLVEALSHADIDPASIDLVAGVESRGFFLTPFVADILGVGIVAVRKAGKLPGPTLKVDYELEYGTASLEIHSHQLPLGAKVFVVDDVLATGGTAAATAELILLGGATVAGFGFLIELSELKGSVPLKGFSENIISLVKYP